MMIANNFEEFVSKIEDAERIALNTAKGQELTKELLKMKLEENPNMTQDEWQRTKSEFMTFIFCQFVIEYPEAMQEMGTHVYNELNK